MIKSTTLLRLFILASLLVAAFVPLLSVSAGTGCYYIPTDDCDFDGVFNLEDNCWLEANADQQDTDGDHIGDACDKEPCTVNGRGYMAIPNTVEVDLSCFETEVETVAPSAGEPAFHDGRLNQRVLDGAAPLAVYCNSLGGFDVYWINELAQGELVIRVIERQVEEGTGLIEYAEVSGGEIMVYKLEDGLFQINLGDYVFQWDGCVVVYE